MAIKLKSSPFVKSLIKNHKLAGHLDKALLEGEFEWDAKFSPKRGDTAWHPSGDCLPSPLALYHKATEDEPGRGPTPSLLKTYTVGHFWHAYIQWIVVERLGFASWDEIERKGETVWARKSYGDAGPKAGEPKPFHWATGAADIAPCHVPGYGECLVDIKTMGSFDFKKSGIPDWCAHKYEAQVNIYMDWFDLEKCIILCVSKDSPHDYKEFIFHRNQPLVDAIYDKWKLVSDCIDQKVPPPEDYDIPLPFLGVIL